MFQLGDTVVWTSQSAGIVRTKRGQIVEIVPPYHWPQSRIKGGGNRNHESYVIRAATDQNPKRTRLYWPRVAQLRAVHCACVHVVQTQEIGPITVQPVSIAGTCTKCGGARDVQA